ncbi:FAD-dependent monooxygenase, partial [Candidatus Pelagibacter sp.]|nr:FAD-dependent monooxygenase [Candidatus Pelagibacter sp.]
GPLAFLPVSSNKTSVVYSIHFLKSKKKVNIEDLIKYYNFKYKIKKIEKIESFELKSLNLRSYYHNNILAFGDILHRVHPLAGQGFNMTIRDTRTLLDIIKNKYSLGLGIDSSINKEFENTLKHKNYIFSNGVDFVHEFFNFERKINTNVLSKTVKIIAKNSYIKKFLINIADKGITI